MGKVCSVSERGRGEREVVVVCYTHVRTTSVWVEQPRPLVHTLISSLSRNLAMLRLRGPKLK